MTSYAELKEEIECSIQGVNRYNPNNIENLEACILLMIKENQYDKDILLTTLKLYQFNTEKYNESFVCQILLKTMMVFPRNDYALAKYLIDSNRIESPDLRRVMDIGALLESCNFGLFWRLLHNEYRPLDSPDEKFKNPSDVKRIIEKITGFEDAVRLYVSQVINVTFQRIDKSQLARLLGGVSDNILASYAHLYGWENRNDGTYFINNHEDTIKSRNIEEKLKFEHEIMTEKTIGRLLNKCRNIVNGNTNFENGLLELKEIVESNSNGPSILFDVLTTLDIECGPKSGDNCNFRKLLLSIIDEFIPSEILNLELNALEADDNSTKSRIIKIRTRLYYKQPKFNLLREESEGYAKLLTEVLSTNLKSDEAILIIERLIGQFNLDPNRVIDIVLDCFEQNVSDRGPYLDILKKFNIHRDDLRNILATKFIFCDKSNYTPMDLCRVASILCQSNLIDLIPFFSMIFPIQSDIIEESKMLSALVKKRVAKAEIISSGSLADSSIAAASSAMLSNDLNIMNGPEPLTSTLSSISFESASFSQITEDRKLSGTFFDDSEVLPKNQKLAFLCALLEHGAWHLAQQLLDYFPEDYPMGKSNRICSSIANIIGYSIEPFYKLKYSHWSENYQSGAHSSWRKFTYFVEQVKKWEDFSTLVLPLLNYIGPYITVRHEVAIKLIRLITIFYEENEEKKSQNFTELNNAMIDICDRALVPGSSLLDSNFAYCEELWQILQRFTPENRYRIYGRWKNKHTARCWNLNIQRGKVLGMTRYAMKRLSKDTAKVVGRQLGKLCHTYPLVALDYMLDKVQDFQNFISPVVDSMRFLSNLGFDVLSYCLIENLSNSVKDQFKTSNGAFSLWLISLASFTAAVYKRYSIDFTGLLQYIANQLKNGKNLDLIVLREVVSNISGVESGTDLTQEHLEALCGGDYLRQEAGFSSQTKINRRAVARLKDALLKNNIFESLCILISQQKNFIVYKDYKEYPLKLITHMLDQSQETFVQFFYFLRSNLKPDEYAKRVPTVSSLISNFYLPIEAAMCLTRSVYLYRINNLYETAKKSLKENGKKGEDPKTKLSEVHKTSLFKNSFEKIINSLEEEMNEAFPEDFWSDITSRLYATFWIFSVNDLSAPIIAYKREIEKCRKELGDVSETITKSRRSVKDEERLKNLEQKLSEEMRKQTEHVARIEKIFDKQKEFLFASSQNRTSQMLRFLQSCILPRAVFSEVDAVYCAKFIETLHIMRTGFFQTVVFFDKIFTDITPILAGLTERETNCFGRFCCMCLDLIHRWHSSASIFEKECEGYPGCITKIRKRDPDDSGSAEPFSFEYYRSICYKWQSRLMKSFTFLLASSNYILIRNALTLMTKILPNFPILTFTVKTIEKSVITLRDNEKGKRLDLNLLASSYLVQLTKRTVRIFEPRDYFNSKVTKIFSSVNNNEKVESNTKVGSLTPKRKRQIVEPKTQSNLSDTPESVKKKSRDV